MHKQKDMNEILEILKYTLPALITGATAYYVTDRVLSRSEKERMDKMRLEAKRSGDPLRLQAIERLTLLCERISPQNLAIRIPSAGATSAMYHAELLKSIRSEFDHNITQQVYVNQQSWEAVKNAREETIKLINYAYSEIGPNAKGTDLAQIILEMTMKIEKLPTDIAVYLLREEARHIL